MSLTEKSKYSFVANCRGVCVWSVCVWGSNKMHQKENCFLNFFKILNVLDLTFENWNFLNPDKVFLEQKIYFLIYKYLKLVI